MMLKKYKIYIINLKRDKKRKKHIIEELKKQKITNYEIVDAIDGNALPPKELKSKTYKNTYNKKSLEYKDVSWTNWVCTKSYKSL